MPLMTLGMFVFEMQTTPYNTYDRFTEQRWETQARAGAAPAAQWLGPGDDSITLEGVLAPELTGGAKHLDTLRKMANGGKAWILVDGNGAERGRWYIESVSEKGSFLTANGQARKIEFSVRLGRYWDNDPEALGDLRDSE